MGVRRITKRGKPYLLIDFYYTDIFGKSRRFRKTADLQTMTAAKAEETRLRNQAAKTGSPFVKAPPSITFKEFVDKHWQGWSNTHHKPSTRLRIESMLRNQLMQAFGNVPLAEITTLKLHEYVGAVFKQGINPIQRLRDINSVLIAAHTLGLLPTRPAMPMRMPCKQKLPDCPTPAEIRKMIDLAANWLKVVLAIAAFAGLRSGEIRALHVGDVDWERKLIVVRRGMSADELTTTKTNRERVVPIAPELEPILRMACEGRAPTARVVVNRCGTPIGTGSIGSRLKRLLLKHGMRLRTPHSLRHAFCTLLLEQGASIELVRVVAGHSSIVTTSGYLHACSADAHKFMGPIQALGNGRPAGSA